MISCAISGIPIEKYKFGYDEEDELCVKIKVALLDTITILYEGGVKCFIIGVDCGADMWAAEIIIGLMKLPLYSEIKLYCFIAYEEQATKWPPYLRNRYFRILEKCTWTKCIGSEVNSFSFLHRNEQIAKSSNMLLCVSKRNEYEETYMMNISKSMEKMIICIDPDSAEISMLYK